MGTGPNQSNDDIHCCRIAVIGRGRLGNAIARALRDAGHHVDGPLGRGEQPEGAEIALLCVPDAEIAPLAASIAPGPVVGHCSGAGGLDLLAPHEGFSLHPLMTLTGDASAERLRGCPAAIAATSPRALQTASLLARSIGTEPFELDEDDRATYHAAAAIASNFLVTLEAAAERLAATAGLDRWALVPLVRATVENWAELGGERALTGPIARGDEQTVERQRDAIAARAPELLELFDALADATRHLAGAVR
jgi:predicted short-subunit dehydrogenase-like oxidoreductase (DUF2520 family)